MLEIEFLAKVPNSGFEWVDLRRRGWTERERFLVHVSGGDPGGVRRKIPRALFRSFAELQPNELIVLGFANQYGSLGITANGPVFKESGGEPNSGFLVSGETLSEWKNEILAMRSAVALWDALMKPDHSVLEALIRWTDVSEGARDVAVLYFDPAALEFGGRMSFEIASEGTPEVLARFTRGEMFGPARYALQRLINPKLREHPTVPKLLRESIKKGKESLRVRNAPESLISALWAQLAYAIDGDRLYSRCEQCGTPVRSLG